jgi:predicted amidohydrolase YtcJ
VTSAEPRAWVGGRVFTGRRYADAVLVEEGRVSVVGDDREVRRSMPGGTVVTELGGRVVLPGFIDPHLHWLLSVVDATGVDARGCRNLAEIRDRLVWIRDHVADGPILGGGWDESVLDEHRYPTRDDLDQVERRRPVALSRICHHAAVVNSAALEQFQIDETTPDPPGGRIGHDANGRPTGLLFERAMEPLKALQLASFRAHGDVAVRFLRSILSRGVTTIGAMGALAGEIRLARDRRFLRAPPLRIRFYPMASETEAWRRGSPSSHDSLVRVAGVKVSVDGSLGARTAWLESPYSDRPEETGLPLVTEEELVALAEKTSARRLPLALHAIGDRALRLALDALARAEPVPRPRIEHASVIGPELWSLLETVQPTVVVQPRFLESDRWL